jgi:hypothetical protein
MQPERCAINERICAEGRRGHSARATLEDFLCERGLLRGVHGKGQGRSGQVPGHMAPPPRGTRHESSETRLKRRCATRRRRNQRFTGQVACTTTGHPARLYWTREIALGLPVQSSQRQPFHLHEASRVAVVLTNRLGYQLSTTGQNMPRRHWLDRSCPQRACRSAV